MAGFIIGGILYGFAIYDRHSGQVLSADIDLAAGMLAMSIQWGFNAVVDAIRKR